MQQILLSCEFLIAAASCNPDQLDNVVTNLSEISSSIEVMNNIYLLEEDLLLKLIERQKYPSEGHFAKNIKDADDCVYSAKDVVRIVNNILDHSRQFDYMSNSVFDLVNQTLAPNFLPQNTRSTELFTLLEGVSLHNEFSSSPAISVLHQCSVNNFKTTIFSATVTDTSESHDRTLPYSFQRVAKLDSDYKSFLIEITISEIAGWNLDPEFKIRLAIYIESLKELKVRNESWDEIGFKDIVLSPSFVRSLEMNSSWFGQPFFNVSLGVLAKLFARSPNLTIDYFFESEGNVARTHGEYTAYRVHITKSNQALRLLFWKNNSGKIVLANVGPKQELQIENPV